MELCTEKLHHWPSTLYIKIAAWPLGKMGVLVNFVIQELKFYKLPSYLQKLTLKTHDLSA